MKKILFLLVVFNLLLIPNVIAKQGHMKLLAVRETESGYEGGIADLYLETKPGSGRVFLETFPLTRTDTQMSTRFAKAVACDIIERDCDDTDFFYTITADSAIIAGPSAGSSIAVLTIAMLEELELNEEYAITGTINSGGLIGPVGGLKAKIEAAKRNGLKKVFIPSGETIARIYNTTTTIGNLSKELSIEIAEVSTLSEAVREFTGRKIGHEFNSISISEEYTSTMKSLARELCDRSGRLKAEARNINQFSNISQLKENANNLTIKGREAFEKRAFYSSASYCFGANVEYSNLLLLSKNYSKGGSIRYMERLGKEIVDFIKKVESLDKKTISDLEAYIVVKERLGEAQDSLSRAAEILNGTNSTESIARTLAYASERVNSAYSWGAFLGKKGRAFNLNKDVLKKSCQNKISEADERKQYVELYLPGTLDNVKKGIERAGRELEKGNYELCLSIASKAKADVDIILSVFGVDSEQYRNIVERKLEIVKNNIARQSANGIFPILGYSYYEYANSLKESDIFSALLYSEYALELGNLDIYFKESNGKKKATRLDKKMLGIFLAGVLAGAVAASLIKSKNAAKKPEKSKAKKRKK